ncbi:MAG: PAS domain-containing protein [Alphaproteobacteria bacterium]|nr:PAS domain-containing protein [Alphaproteobacteria bacterium]
MSTVRPHTYSSLESHGAPETSSVTDIPLDGLENSVTRTAASYWRLLRGDRALPARSRLSPRDLQAILRNVVLLRVIDGGADYEYRIVGELFSWAYGVNFQGMQLTQIEQANPEHGARMRRMYERTRLAAAPRAIQGWVGKDNTTAKFVYYETVLLPFGEDGRTVDHILVVSFHVPRAPD